MRRSELIEDNKNVLLNKNKRSIIKIALLGNPNSGKSSVFNALTGLKQKTANFPGVTVDKKIGYLSFNNKEFIFIDLPGLHSLSGNSENEKVAIETLLSEKENERTDLVLYIADASNLNKSLFLFSQLLDLNIPSILVLNMWDIAIKKGININIKKLENLLKVPVIFTIANKNIGIGEIKEIISKSTEYSERKKIYIKTQGFLNIENFFPQDIDIGMENKDYLNFQKKFNTSFILKDNTLNIDKIDKGKIIRKEILARHKKISEILKESIYIDKNKTSSFFTKKLDNILMHKIWGFLIFLFIMFLIFQSIFFLADIPMSIIDNGVISIQNFLSANLPDNILSDLLINGFIAGVGGIIIFIPQIAILFFFIALLEDSGYLSRVSFIMDKIMRPFGMNGRSVIPLMSGMACAVPAILSTRIISNWKERIITILSLPLITCSARLPVYILLISLLAKNTNHYIQGTILMSLYLLGVLSALFVAFLYKIFIKRKMKSYFIMEIPEYKMPNWKNILSTMIEKVKIFTFDAGKIILSISVILWVLAYNVPQKAKNKIEKKYSMLKESISKPGYNGKISKKQLELDKSAELLQNSYAAKIGKSFEPLIKPLGYNWKIGLAILTSFAAREVFVGTLATIYSVGSTEKTESIINKMAQDKNEETGKPLFSLATILSLLVFYAFSMQCMSTMAIVFRETKHWKWPLIQFILMGTLAYTSSFLVYNLFK